MSERTERVTLFPTTSSTPGQNVLIAYITHLPERRASRRTRLARWLRRLGRHRP